MPTETEYHSLLERYRRVRIAAQAVVDGAVAVGDAEHPRCGVEPHLIRILRRELSHEPQPSSLRFESMSVS